MKVIRIYKTRQIIFNHENDPYLIRYFLYKPKEKGLLWHLFGVNRIYLHHIIRSDYDRALHSHPWSFTSILLWGSYLEVADMRDTEKYNPDGLLDWEVYSDTQDMREFTAPCILHRPAQWRHRLELKKPVWSLVFTSEKKQRWGFWNGDKFCHWRQYDYVNLTCAEPWEIQGDAGSS